MTADDDVEAFLQMFENTATQEGWESDDWARLLAPLLTGEAQRAYFAMPSELAGRYGELKREILARLGLSSVCAAQYFHDWDYKSRLPARAQAAELSRLARHWLLDGEPTAAQVAERVVIDRFLRALPRSHRQAVGMRNPNTVAELVEAVELADAAQHRDAGERAWPFPRRVVQERRVPEGTSRPVARPAAPVQKDEPMPTADPTSPARTWLAGCTISAAPGAWPVEVGVVKDLPVPVLIGRDWPGFDRLLAAAIQPVSTKGSRRRRRLAKGGRGRPALLASDSGRDGESPPPNPNLYHDLFQQVTGGGSFAKEQREDDRLKHCWTQVRMVEEKETQPGPHPLPHFIVRNGLLYCVARRRGRTKPYWWCPGRRRKRCWNWPTRTPWRATLGLKTPPNESVTVSNGQGWKPRSNGSVRPAPPAKGRRRGSLPPAH